VTIEKKVKVGATTASILVVVAREELAERGLDVADAGGKAKSYQGFKFGGAKLLAVRYQQTTTVTLK
jgi:hypothetical protein